MLYDADQPAKSRRLTSALIVRLFLAKSFNILAEIDMGVDHEEVSFDLAHKYIFSICPVWYDKTILNSWNYFIFGLKCLCRVAMVTEINHSSDMLLSIAVEVASKGVFTQFYIFPKAVNTIICGQNYLTVKSGIFGQTAKFGQPPCLFHSSIIGIKNKLTKQTVKILMRRLIKSRLIWISTVCKCVSEFA